VAAPNDLLIADRRRMTDPGTLVIERDEHASGPANETAVVSRGGLAVGTSPQNDRFVTVDQGDSHAEIGASSDYWQYSVGVGQSYGVQRKYRVRGVFGILEHSGVQHTGRCRRRERRQHHSEH
jgi:hypothetical protein